MAPFKWHLSCVLIPKILLVPMVIVPKCDYHVNHLTNVLTCSQCCKLICYICQWKACEGANEEVSNKKLLRIAPWERLEWKAILLPCILAYFPMSKSQCNPMHPIAFALHITNRLSLDCGSFHQAIRIVSILHEVNP
jgi:hypothetical protein